MQYAKSIYPIGIVLWLAVSAQSAYACADIVATPVTQAAEENISFVAYMCESGQKIMVRYDNTNPDIPTATLEYKGQTFEMYNVRSGSGARYATEQGLAPDKGLQWWTKGDDAMLGEMLMDHTAPEPTPLEHCTAKSGA